MKTAVLFTVMIIDAILIDIASILPILFSIDDYYLLLFFKICDFSLLISKLGHCFNIDGGLAIGAT